MTRSLFVLVGALALVLILSAQVIDPNTWPTEPPPDVPTATVAAPDPTAAALEALAAWPAPARP